MTSIETYLLFIIWSKYLYHFWEFEYPVNTHLTALGSNLSFLLPFIWTKHTLPKTLDSKWDGFDLGSTIWSRVFPLRIFEVVLFIKYAKVSIISDHKYFGTFIPIIKERVTSRMCLFFLLVTSFCCEVYGQFVCDLIPCNSNYFLSSKERYSLPLSDLNILIVAS